jgi:hypothetical protein
MEINKGWMDDGDGREREIDEIFVCGARDCLSVLLPISADFGISSGRAGPIYSFTLLDTTITTTTTTTMNWTGGRLRRHSNNNSRTATLSKVQKQNFAKSRTKAPKDSHHNLPFQGFAQFRQLRKDGPQNDEAGAGSGETIHVSTQQVTTHSYALNAISD